MGGQFLGCSNYSNLIDTVFACKFLNAFSFQFSLWLRIELIDSDGSLDSDPNVTLHPHNGL